MAPLRTWTAIASIAACLTLGLANVVVGEDVAPLSQAHAHNDYLHRRPLLDAIDHGFCSVEADVWLVDGELLVAHTAPELRKERTLELLYLKPLADRCDQRGGWVYKPGETVTLLIDFKSQGGETYNALNPLLAKYGQLFEPRKVGAVEDATAARAPAAGLVRPIAVIISGDRPFEAIVADGQRLCGIDGRLSDLDSKLTPEQMPLVSDNWSSHFQWRGQGPIPAKERDKLRAFVADVHAQGRRLRFWATPDNEAAWSELVAAGVDLIGTDDLGRLARFLSRPEGKP